MIAGLFIILIFTAFILQLRNKHSKKLKGHLLKIQEKNDEKDMLLKEIHHRVKNNLQVITGLLSLQTVNIDDPKIKELFGYSQMRIQSMALIHEMLYQSKSISTINYQNYIKELINSLILSFKGNEHKIKTHLSVPSINLNIDTAITLGLIINEIITNALKYGIPGSNSGNLSVEMIENKLNNYTLKIGDDGIGLVMDLIIENPIH